MHGRWAPNTQKVLMPSLMSALLKLEVELDEGFPEAILGADERSRQTEGTSLKGLSLLAFGVEA